MLPVTRRFCALESNGHWQPSQPNCRAHTPAAALAGAWSEVLRHGVATAVRLAAGGRRSGRGSSPAASRGARRRPAPTSRRWSPSAMRSTTRARPNCSPAPPKCTRCWSAAESAGTPTGCWPAGPDSVDGCSSWSEGIERWTRDPRRGPRRGDDRPARRFDRGVGRRGPAARRTAGADHGRGRAQLPGASGHAAGRHGRAGRLPVPVARDRHARRYRRPEARGDRSRGEDRALGRPVGRVGRAVDLRAARRRRSGKRPRTRRRVQPARLLRVAAAVPLADAGPCVPRWAAGRTTW